MLHVLLGVVLTTNAAADQLTLEHALAMAAERNLTVRRAGTLVTGEEARLATIRAQRRPSLELSQRYTRLDDRTVEQMLLDAIRDLNAELAPGSACTA